MYAMSQIKAISVACNVFSKVHSRNMTQNLSVLWNLAPVNTGLFSLLSMTEAKTREIRKHLRCNHGGQNVC
jgi:hypothetical protein